MRGCATCEVEPAVSASGHVRTVSHVSNFALLVLAIAVAILLASVGLLATLVRRFPPRPHDEASPSEGASTEPTDEAPEDSLLLTPIIFAPEYLDADGLTDLAVELEVDVDPVRVEATAQEVRTTHLGADVDARLTIPGVAEVAANIAGADTVSEVSQQTVGTTRRQSFTSRMTDIVRGLAARGQLRHDLTLLPPSSRHLSVLAQNLIVIYDEWALRTLPETPAAPPTPTATQVLAAAAASALAPPQTPAPPAPTPSPDQILRDSIDLLWRRTLEQLVVAKRAELAPLVNELSGITYALAYSTWRAAAEADGSKLRLYNADLRPTDGSLDEVALPTSAVVEVPLHPERLTDSGRQRLIPGASYELIVFGRIGDYSAERGTLVVHPLAIFVA